MNDCVSRANGLMVWFSFRVREVPGSIPGWPLFSSWNCVFVMKTLLAFQNHSKSCWSLASMKPNSQGVLSWLKAICAEWRPYVLSDSFSGKRQAEDSGSILASKRWSRCFAAIHESFPQNLVIIEEVEEPEQFMMSPYPGSWNLKHKL